MELISGTNDLLGALSKFSLLVPIAGLSLMGFLALYIWNRTRSTYSLMSRLWQLFHGKRDCKEKTIASFLDCQTALMQFRFTTGVQARTTTQSHALIAWSERNNEDMGAIAACGPYFDLEKVALRESLPRPGVHFAKFVITLGLFLALVTLCMGVILPRALLQSKASGQFFTFSASYAKPIWADGGLAKDQCIDPKHRAASGFGANDTALICGMFEDPTVSKFVSENVFEQRILFGFMALNFMAYFAGSFRWLMQGLRACEMRKRMTNRAAHPLTLEVIPE